MAQAAALSEESEEHGWNSNRPHWGGVRREERHLRSPKVAAQCHLFYVGKAPPPPSPDRSRRDNKQPGDASAHVRRAHRVDEGEKSYPVMMISG